MTITPNDVSVIIPSYNSRKTIAACLESLICQEQAPGEIILVDSSTDGTLRLVHENYPTVRIRHFNNPTFPGPARNRGVSIAQGEVIAFIDSDCIAPSDWVSRIAARHAEGREIVGGSIEVGNPDSLVAWAGHLGEFREFLPLGKLRTMRHIPTCNISYRRTILDRFGGFPNAYYPQEDLLFNALLHQTGLAIWFDPEIRIRHFYREYVRDFLSHQHRIGRVTLSTLRRVKMPGSWIARSDWVACAFAPVLAAVKLFRTSFRLFVFSPLLAARRLDLLGLLLLGSIWWARGFSAGARQGLNGVSPVDDPDEPIFQAFSPSPQSPESDS